MIKAQTIQDLDKGCLSHGYGRWLEDFLHGDFSKLVTKIIINTY